MLEYSEKELFAGFIGFAGILFGCIYRLLRNNYTKLEERIEKLEKFKDEKCEKHRDDIYNKFNPFGERIAKLEGGKK